MWRRQLFLIRPAKHRPFTPIVIFFSLFATFASFVRAEVHPLDALSAAEIAATTAIVQADPRTKDLRFQLITLAEPEKAAVLAWQPGTLVPRRAQVTAAKDDRVFEIVVDLTSKSIATLRVRTGVKVPLTLAESSDAVEAARNDPGMIAALARRTLS